jgi:hypothetical protein
LLKKNTKPEEGKEDWLKFLEAGMRERERNIKEWHSNNQHEWLYSSDEEPEEEVLTKVTPKRSQTTRAASKKSALPKTPDVRKIVEKINSRSSTQKSTLQENKEESEEESVSDSDTESKHDSGEVSDPLEALNDATTIQEVIETSKSVARLGGDDAKVHKIKILKKMRDVIMEFEDGTSGLMGFKFNANGSFGMPKTGFTSSKADLLNRINKKIKTLREVK